MLSRELIWWVHADAQPWRPHSRTLRAALGTGAPRSPQPPPTQPRQPTASRAFHAQSTTPHIELFCSMPYASTAVRKVFCKPLCFLLATQRHTGENTAARAAFDCRARDKTPSGINNYILQTCILEVFVINEKQKKMM